MEDPFQASLSAVAPALLAIAVLSVLMVAVMVRFSRAVLSARDPAALPRSSAVARWGAAYLLVWAGLIAAFLFLIERTDAPLAGRNLVLLVGVTTGWFAVHALLLWFIRAIIRANERQSAYTKRAGRREPAAVPLPPGPRRSLWDQICTVLLILLVIAIAEAIPPLKAAEVWMAARQPALLLPVIVMAAAGFLLLMGGAIHLVLTGGQDETVSFAEIKRAFRRHAWRSDPYWRRFFLMMAGAALMLLGLFGMAIVLGTAGIKVVFAIALIYAVVRTASGFARAEDQETSRSG